MEAPRAFESFSLLGGPLHRLGCRLRLVRGGTNTLALGLVLGVVPWTVAVLLAFSQGGAQQLLSLPAIGAHVRLLVAIPLFFLCEKMLDPRVTTFVGMLVRSGLVAERALPALDSRLARTRRLKDSWLMEGLFLLAAVLFSVFGPRVHLTGSPAVVDPVGAGLELAGAWYWMVCMPLFRFLMLRWLWRLGLWSHLLWCVSRLELQLLPTQPDGAAGLGYLEVVHAHFAPLVFSLSALEAASFAQEISAGAVPFESLYPALALMLLVQAVVFLGPLLIFTPKLWACRVKGLRDYMEFAQRYVRGFDQKWLGSGAAPAESLLGTPDIQSLADLSTSFAIVRNMRLVPASPRLAIDLGIFALLPILPLFLLKYPIAELAEKLLTRLVGI